MKTALKFINTKAHDGFQHGLYYAYYQQACMYLKNIDF